MSDIETFCPHCAHRQSKDIQEEKSSQSFELQCEQCRQSFYWLVDDFKGVAGFCQVNDLGQLGLQAYDASRTFPPKWYHHVLGYQACPRCSKPFTLFFRPLDHYGTVTCAHCRAFLISERHLFHVTIWMVCVLIAVAILKYFLATDRTVLALPLVVYLIGRFIVTKGLKYVES